MLVRDEPRRVRASDWSGCRGTRARVQLSWWTCEVVLKSVRQSVPFGLVPVSGLANAMLRLPAVLSAELTSTHPWTSAHSVSDPHAARVSQANQATVFVPACTRFCQPPQGFIRTTLSIYLVGRCQLLPLTSAVAPAREQPRANHMYYREEASPNWAFFGAVSACDTPVSEPALADMDRSQLTSASVLSCAGRLVCPTFRPQWGREGQIIYSRTSSMADSEHFVVIVSE